MGLAVKFAVMRAIIQVLTKPLLVRHLAHCHVLFGSKHNSNGKNKRTLRAWQKEDFIPWLATSLNEASGKRSSQATPNLT